MVQKDKGFRVLKIILFAFAVCLGILGCFLVLDALVPKERPVVIWVPVVEFLLGASLLMIAIYVGRKNRISRKRADH